MEKINCCFFCTSTFQLLPIISLVLSLNLKGDLYIEPVFRDVEAIVDRIKALNIFKHIVIIPHDEIYNKFFKSKHSGLYNHIEIAKTYIYPEKIAQMILVPNTVYDIMFISARAYLVRMVQLHIIKQKYPTEISFFDDGAGSYFNFAVGKPRFFWDSVLRILMFGKKSLNSNCEGYLFNPETFKKISPKSSHKIHKIERIWEKENGKRIFKTLFPMMEDAIFSEKAIIIDTMNADIFSTEEIKDLYSIYKLIGKKLGRKNVVIKKHPRDTSHNNQGFLYYEHSEMPFEFICMNTDISKKIIISYSSTAAATPKMIFNQEPFVIILYKLMQRGKKIKRSNNFFETIQLSYSEPNRFFIPESIDDLEKSLDIIAKCS